MYILLGMEYADVHPTPTLKYPTLLGLIPYTHTHDTHTSCVSWVEY